MIFKSKAFRFDVFNWSDSYLRLPEIPSAITSYNGRLFAFGQSKIYRIDPETLVVEETIPGAGCFGQRSLCITELGIFFADANGIYLTDGQNLHHIGAAIRDTLDSNGVSWRQMRHNNGDPVLLYSPELKQVHCITYSSHGTSYSFCYHIPTKRWDIWSVPQVTNDGNGDPLYPGTSFGVVGKHGEMNWFQFDGALRIAGDLGERLPYVWKSKRFLLGAPTQLKRFYEFSVDAESINGDPISSIYVMVVDGEAASVNSGGRHPTKTYGKWCEFHIFGNGVTPGNDIIRNITLLFRRMVGLR